MYINKYAIIKPHDSTTATVKSANRSLLSHFHWMHILKTDFILVFFHSRFGLKSDPIRVSKY
jgi:hypothetical protein